MNTTTYTYEIINLITRDDEPPRLDNVTQVVCSITATNYLGRTLLSGHSFNLQDGETFIPFADLDEATVRSWVDAQTNQWNLFKYQMDQTFEQLVTPEPKVKHPPWVPTAEDQAAAILEMLSTATTSTLMSTSTSIVGGIQPSISEDYIKALIYEVLEEINNSNV